MRHCLAWIRVVAVVIGLVVSLPSVSSASSGGDNKPPAMDFAAGFAEVERLVSENKLEVASGVLEVLLGTAQAAGDEEAWTRALVQAVQLRSALHKPERAVRFLRDQPWPQGAAHRVLLDLLYADALTAYSRAYRWEIFQRERVDSGAEVDLGHWSQEQITEAALAAGLDAWSRREELGDVSVARFSFYLEPGNYPERVRGTLRDALSYSLAGLLADSDLWTGRDRDDVAALDFPALIRGGDFAPPHPLTKMAAVLVDLEAWHLAAGRREAALEARLERLRRLHAASSVEEDRELIRRELEAVLPSFRDVPWWSMGMATLAELERQENDPNHLVRAHEAAVAGRDAYPDSPGGLRCRAIAEQIEAPEFSLASMSSDGLGRRSWRRSSPAAPGATARPDPPP